MTSQPSPTPRRVLLIVLTALLTSVSRCGVVNATVEPPLATYQLSGSAPVADYVSYETATGQTLQAHVPLPWKTQFKSFGGYEEFVLSAQSPGSITCTILLDGKVVSQATSNGAPARTVCTH
jgi:hypothetical protein